MNGKRGWVGIAPSPKVFDQLDQEEISVLALLAWSSATNRPVTARDIAALPDRNGTPLGADEAKSITETLADLKIASVLGMRNDRPLSVFLGGFQPASAARGSMARPQSPHRSTPLTQAPRIVPAARPARSDASPHRDGTNYTPPKPPAPKIRFSQSTIGSGRLIENKKNGLPNLRMRRATPRYVEPEVGRLRKATEQVDGGKFGDDLVAAAAERLRILKARIALYERWLKDEPDHAVLAAYLHQKRAAIPELERQLEQARMPGGSKRQQKRKAREQSGK